MAEPVGLEFPGVPAVPVALLIFVSTLDLTQYDASHRHLAIVEARLVVDQHSHVLRSLGLVLLEAGEGIVGQLVEVDRLRRVGSRLIVFEAIYDRSLD
ncbi:hypothetical protein AB0C77_12795 [Streptomyces sp. NPDC048629]|uniref:hypothetical protein n=1 Tax=Streptomyces sp. NPDC048629 TaxID=3154824 RepID=UPI0034295A52